MAIYYYYYIFKCSTIDTVAVRHGIQSNLGFMYYLCINFLCCLIGLGLFTKLGIIQGNEVMENDNFGFEDL